MTYVEGFEDLLLFVQQHPDVVFWMVLLVLVLGLLLVPWNHRRKK